VAVTNLQEFKIGVTRRIDESRERHRQRVRAAVLYGLQNLVFGTRVDTGRARGNWQVTEGDPAMGYDWERKDMAGREGNRDTFAEESAAIGAASGADIIWIHNGLPYISILEGLDHMLVGAVEALKTWLRSNGAPR